MKQLNFNKFVDVSEKDKKTINLFYNILSKKFDLSSYRLHGKELNYLIGVLGTKVIPLFDVIKYFYMLSLNYDNLIKPIDHEFYYKILLESMDDNFLKRVLFDFIIKKISKNKSFHDKVGNCLNDINFIEKEGFDEKYEVFIEQDISPIFTNTFSVIQHSNNNNRWFGFFYLRIQYSDSKENNLSIQLLLSKRNTESYEQTINVEVDGDKLKEISEDDIVYLICEKIKPEIIDFLNENLFKGNNTIVNENYNKKDMKKIIRLTENDIERIIQQIMESEKISEGKKKSGTKLCARGKAAAKSKFKVYPSAYANGYAVQVCKGTKPGLDGKKRCSPPYC